MKLNQSVDLSGKLASSSLIQLDNSNQKSGRYNLPGLTGASPLKSARGSDYNKSPSPSKVGRSSQMSPKQLGNRLAQNTIPQSQRSSHARNSSYDVRSFAQKEVKQLSQSMVIEKKQFKVSLQDMVNSSKKCIDNWGLQGYEYGRPLHPNFPEKPTSYNKPNSCLINKDSGKPQDYFSMLQKNKKNVPAPNQYKFESEMFSGLIGKGGKFFIPKGNTPTYYTNIQTDGAKRAPGVGRYFTEPETEKQRTKILGCYTQKSEGGGYTDEAKFKGMETPSHFDPIEMDKIRNRTLATKIVKPSAVEEEKRKAVRTNDPSPHTYKIEEAKDKFSSSIIKYTFSKNKQESFIDKALKKVTGKNAYPQVGKYNLDKVTNFNTSKVTIGARRGYK